jgi:hypothetical protein
MRRGLVGSALILLAIPAPGPAAAPATSCVACHADAVLAGEGSAALVASFADDVHQAAGLSCQDCHGGNPDPALAERPAAAMDEGFSASPFVGAPGRVDVPGFCGRCHSDPNYMKRFAPGARIDQEREYWTSRHGVLLRTGDPNVATCVDCHGAHGILGPADLRSPVHPKRVAVTCSRCHADPKRMAGYTLPDGRPLPTDQYARWRLSTHATALLERDDLAAPTCNDCHGNHGAVPPGLDSIAFVCGGCHGREAELFRASPKAAGFRTHQEFMASVGAAGCGACHQPPSPAAALGAGVTFTECSTCHGNHGIVPPNITLLGSLPEAPCDFCHAAVAGPGAPVSGPEPRRRRYERVRSTLIEEAKAQGLEGTERFDWLVDRALALPFHISRETADKTEFRPEFSRLFTKFRIGKTYYAYRDPESGESRRVPLVRCTDCHTKEPPGKGFETAQQFVDQMWEITALTARTERTLLAARRGGVEVRNVAPEVDQAVNAQIELEALVHTFSSAPGSAFVEKAAAGRQQAEEAIRGADEALAELAFRRRGLFVFVGLLVLVLVGLGLKIQQLTRDEQRRKS